jgi:hypothetical protein
MRDRQRQRIWLLVNEGKARVDDNVGGDKVIVKEGWCLFNTLSKYSNFKSCDSRLFFLFHSSHTPCRMQVQYRNFIGQRKARLCPSVACNYRYYMCFHVQLGKQPDLGIILFVYINTYLFSPYSYIHT